MAAWLNQHVARLDILLYTEYGGTVDYIYQLLTWLGIVKDKIAQDGYFIYLLFLYLYKKYMNSFI